MKIFLVTLLAANFLSNYSFSSNNPKKVDEDPIGRHFSDFAKIKAMTPEELLAIQMNLKKFYLLRRRT